MNTTPIHQTEEAAAAARPRVMLAFDPLLVGAAIGLVGCSYVTLRAAGWSSLAQRQVEYAAIGLVAAAILAAIDYTWLRRLRWALYGLTIGLNLVVFGIAAPQTGVAAGAHRWIPLPLFQLQPSELGKVMLIVTLAAIAVERARRPSEIRMTFRILLLAALPALLVVAQPDLGTGLVYLVVAVSVLYFSGTSWKLLTALGGLTVLAAVGALAIGPALGVNVLKGYQKQRLTTFINPPQVCHTQTDTTCYQLQQSLTAIGSGGKTGRGAAGATQARYGFIPADQDDFIFAVVGETYGFVGAALVLSLYALMIWRTMRILTMAKNLFGTLVAGGILMMLMFQVFLNVGMTLGIAPVTGVPLPLLSYGGSSVLVTFVAIGLLESIHIQARMASAGKVRALLQ